MTVLYRFFFLLAVFLALSAPARAQLLEAPREKDDVLKLEIKPQQGTGEESVPVPQDGSVALAMQYFDRCMGTLYQDVPVDPRGDFCMCSADKARSALTDEELAFVATGKNNDPFRRFDPDELVLKMEREASVPCIHFIMRAREKASCLSNGKIRHFFVSQNAYDAMCACLSDDMGGFVRDYGADIIAAVRERNPGASADPAKAISQWSDYKTELGSVTKKCLNMYSHK